MTVHISPAEAAPAVLSFWFDEVGPDRWFMKDESLDRAIAARFGALREAVVGSDAAAWRDDVERLTAAIVLVDQFGRNIYRRSARAFAADALALELCRLGLARGWTDAAPPDHRQFLLMPLMHSETLADQEQALVEFEKLGNANALAFARLHHQQIERFGRFPGRNAALGRRTTEAEQQALDEGAAF